MAVRILTKLIEFFEWDIDDDIKNDQLIEDKFEDLDEIGQAFWFCIFNELDKFKQHIALKMSDFDPNIKNKNGHSLLHIVCCYGYVEFLEYLLSEYKSKINVNIVDRNNNCAIDWASQSGNLKCLKLLIENDANILNVDKDGFFVVVRQMPVYSIGGQNCLHFAAENGNIQCLDLLINHLVENQKYNIHHVINLKDLHGYTPLDLAIMNKNKNEVEYNKCIQLLSKYVTDSDFIGVDMKYKISKEELFQQFVFDYYKSQERIALNFKDTLPGMHGNCCQTCKEMYHISDKQ